MTGGTVPLAATLATNAVFTSFIGDSKVIYCAGFSFVSFLFLCVS
jgi:adenosylmethionine-8-amino-7-oxononanoate aminotransferase